MRAVSRCTVGLVLLIAGGAMIAAGYPPISDYYFPVIWTGYILTLDGFLESKGRPSLWRDYRIPFVLMIPVSAAFWWIFESFNQAVDSWRYIGAGAFSGAGYFILASVSFSTVIPAVWITALCVSELVRGTNRTARGSRLLTTAKRRARFLTHGTTEEMLSDVFPSTESSTTGITDFAGGGRSVRFEHARNHNSGCAAVAAVTTGLNDTPVPRTMSPRPERCIMPSSFIFGVVSIALAIYLPHYAFALIWGAVFFLLDPVNYWLGRASLIQKVLTGDWRTVCVFAVSGLICGFFWEAWNYWSVIKWVYHVPFVSQLHLFEMPLLGYLGYIPFGLEVYAATVFAAPSLIAVPRLFRLLRERHDPLPLPFDGEAMRTHDGDSLTAP